MLNLEYIIVFKTDGIPIYSRCFGHFCSTLMKDDVIFSAFLSALTSAIQAGGLGGKIDYEGTELIIKDVGEGGVITIKIGDTNLVFYYVAHNMYFITLGFPYEKFDTEKDKVDVNMLVDSIKMVLDEDYKSTDWADVTSDEREMFEERLLKKAVYPWMIEHKSSHTCPLGKNCPLRIAMFEAEKNVANAIEVTIKDYRKKSMFSKMMMMMSGIKEKMFRPKATS